MAELRLPSFNRVTLVGRLTRDPELRYIPSGAAVISFRIAVGHRYKAQNGEWKDDPAFVDVVAWQALAERLNQTVKKGSPVLVEGRLATRSWETPDGQKRSAVEVRAFAVQYLERMGPEGKEAEEAPAEETVPESKAPGEDDIPF
jgi:single-strand DNA-binding protein